MSNEIYLISAKYVTLLYVYDTPGSEKCYNKGLNIAEVDDHTRELSHGFLRSCRNRILMKMS